MRKSSYFAAGVCALVLLCGAFTAGAQVSGLYYQEVAKDGRIYVFNTPEKLAAWQVSGDMGVAITLIGRGANGETLVGENDTAIDLYLFRHNLPAYERPTPKPEKKLDDRIFYKDGKTNIVMKTGTVAISNRVQARYTLEDREVEPTGDPDRGSVRIRRMKTAIEGGFADNTWKFKLQANWVGGDVVSNVTQSGTTVSQTRARGPILEDAEVWWSKYPMATIWLGQGKAYFGRQELTSSGKQQLVDRSIASDRFAAGRQIGVGLIGANQTKTLEYNLGVYNGNGINQARNDNDKYMAIGRFAWTPFGEYKLEESSLDYPDSGRLLVGAAGLWNTTGVGTTASPYTDVTRYGLELGYKILGFNAISEYYTERSKATGKAAVDTDGYYAQVGYLFPNKRAELAGRWAVIAPDTAANTDRIETGIAASWYWDKHTHKIQADYRQIEDKARRAKDNEFRVQLQLIF